MILAGLSGQSNARGPYGSDNGNHTIWDGWKTWRNGQDAFGSTFGPADWGTYPLDKVEAGQPYVNNIMQGFVEFMPESVWSVHIAKPAHPIESFILPGTRTNRGWPLPSGATDMSPYLYDDDQGAVKAVQAANKPAFDVWLWHQGEYGVASYFAKLRAMHANMTNAGLFGPNTVFLCGGLWDGGPNYADHKAECIRACEVMPNAAYVDSAGLVNQGGTNVHLRGTALIAMGRRMATKYLEMKGL